jgi:hypothetical protein
MGSGSAVTPAASPSPERKKEVIIIACLIHETASKTIHPSIDGSIDQIRLRASYYYCLSKKGTINIL